MSIRLRDSRCQAEVHQRCDIAEAPVVVGDVMTVDLREYLVLLQAAEDMLHDDPPPRLDSVELAFGSREQPVVPPPLDRDDDAMVWVVARRPIVASVEIVLSHPRHLVSGALALEESVVVGAPRHARTDQQEPSSFIDGDLSLDRVALTLAGVPAALRAVWRPLPGLLGRIGDHVGEVWAALHEFRPGADLLDAGRKPPPERQPEVRIRCLLEEWFESLLQPADGTRIEPHEIAEQLIGEIEAIESEQAQELVRHRGELVLAALADGVLALPLREASLFGLLPEGRQPCGELLELVERQSCHPVELPRVVNKLGKA